MTDIMKTEMSAPIADLRGFRVECTGEGEAVGILDAGPQHANPMGTLHGGVLCDVADAAMGMAFASTLGHDAVAIDQLLSAGVAGQSRAQARVVNRRKNVGYIECDITDQNGKRIANAASTCTVVRRDDANAR